MKVILILVDGMRPDAIAELPQVKEMMASASYAMDAQTVFPSVTLPCHMSLFHSVDPSRHGTTTNIYMPQVRPVEGLCEVLKRNKKTCAFFYNWEQLRDLSRPGSLSHSYFCSGKTYGWERTNLQVTEEAIAYIGENAPDFTFVYLAWTDEAGHANGWLSEEYRKAIDSSWESIRRFRVAFGEEYTILVTADHGGHDRTHGTTMPEDMTIPMFFQGKAFTPGKALEQVNIKDLAPTVAKLLDVEADPEWEGKSLV